MMLITDPEALVVLGEIEGSSWVTKQREQTDSPFGFYAYKKAYCMYLETKEEYPELLFESGLFIEYGDGAIYGDGGYSRYVVDAEGEIFLLKWSTREEKLHKAMELGVRVR